MSAIEVTGGRVERGEEILTPPALAFLADLQGRFGQRRDELLARRRDRRAEIAAAGTPRLPAADRRRAGRGVERSPAAPADLADRRVEITGPTERKMSINALTPGAKVWLADLEDANTPHWAQRGRRPGQPLRRRTPARSPSPAPEGKDYRLPTDRELAVIVPRPRGWHLDERHLHVDGEPLVGALVDFGLYMFHNAAELTAAAAGPTSTCRRRRATSRPACGTTCSRPPRSRSGCRPGPCEPRC